MESNIDYTQKMFWLFLVALLGGLACLPTPLLAQKNALRIECIMIGQTDIYDIGRACEVSMNKCEDWIKDIESATGIPANITRIEGVDYNKANIQNFLSSFSLDDPENTILIFYGTGHGFNYQSNVLKYPVFGVHPTRKQFTGNQFNEFAVSLQKDIHEPLLATGPKFLLTIGELCNELVDDLEVPQEYRNVILPMSPCNGNYEELFSQTQGDIIAASSQRGQLSFTSGLTGGVFFGEFLDAFETAANDCNRTPDWGRILDNAQTNTEAANGQIPIYDVGYIDSPVELISDADLPAPKAAKSKKERRKMKRQEKFKGEDIIAPTIIYIEN